MKRDVDAFTDGTFDLCILGGGITGAGVALDAATRGWRVALIDKGDFASGTSSVSSKLIHGGLRYLEYGHVGLVYEALRERSLLLRNAPHLVQPLPFVIPFYLGQRVPGWKWRAGLTLYDLLAGSDNIVRSRRLSTAHLAHSGTGLRRVGLEGGALYHDAWVDDARLCIAVLKTAWRHGAILANHAEAVAFETLGGRIRGIWAQDRIGSRRFLIRARAVLNATGPWADAVCKLADTDLGPLWQPTKGVHVIVPARGHRCAYLLLHPRDGRVFFVIPWLGKTLIGTTDTFPDAGPDALQVLPSEIQYLLEGYNAYFESVLEQREVMGSFAGLRPLARSGSGSPSALSREFRIQASPTGLVTALGGKYTTFRHMAETIVDFLAQRQGMRRRCRTRSLRLDGAPAGPWHAYRADRLVSIQKEYGIAADSAAYILDRHGANAESVLAVMTQVSSGFERVHPHEPDLVGEQAYLRDEEMAIYPDDLLLRRSRIGMYRPELLRGVSQEPAASARDVPPNLG